MRTYLTRVASSAAVAAVAALALAGPANATPVPVPAKAHTTLSIVEFRNVIKAGQKDVVGGTLRSHGTGLAREVVLLDRLVGGKFVPWKVQLTNKAGRVAFTVSPGVTARYELVFRGTEKLAHTHSGIVTVKVIH
jgi:hypothetical protein